MIRCIFSLLCLLLLAPACVKHDPQEEGPVHDALFYSNLFGYSIMRTYYLWKDEVEDALSSWTAEEDPYQKVEAVRYKDEAGNPVDRWTTLYEDYTRFLGSVTGNQKTFGLEFTAYWANSSKTRICAVVDYTYADSPAQKAGLKRGDVILTIDGEEITLTNYETLLSKLYNADAVKLKLQREKNSHIDLVAEEMYENPVHTVTTFTSGGTKYGYLHFTNFTLDACPDLEKAFRSFKDAGIQELVLDLRYNGGGYTFTSTVLASMIAPLEAVKGKKVFNKDVYNDLLSEKYGDETCFDSSFDAATTAGTVTVKPAEVNPGIRHLWVLVSDRTASASEALICGLKPYMDVTLVGQTTYGKFCGGNLISAKAWFEAVKKSQTGDEELDCDEGMAQIPTVGIYVISSRYSDCNGVTLSMPSGIPADYAATDNPGDGFDLGSPKETMLAVALAAAEGKLSTGAGAPALRWAQPALPAPVHRPGFGVLLH